MRLLLFSISAVVLLVPGCKRAARPAVVRIATPATAASSTPSAPLDVTADVIAPRIVGTPEFQFAASPPRRHGSFTLQLVISEAGSVQEAHVSRSTVDPRLEPAILQSARGWHFEPATLHGRPVSVRHLMSFALEDTLQSGGQ